MHTRGLQPMQLFLIRHAIAAPPSLDQPDATRPLTSEGRTRFVKTVRGAQSLGWNFERLYHSPLTRAVQTAALMRPLVTGSMHALPDLARPPDEEMLAHIEGDTVALVGHEPHLGSLLAWLVTGERRHGAQFVFKKGGFAQLSGVLRPGSMALCCMVTPRLLRHLGSR